MSNTTWSSNRRVMIAEALKQLKELGYKTQRLPGRGLSATSSFEKEEKKGKLCIRTSTDRWFAFPSTGDGWKTLDDVDTVIVVTVDHVDNPQNYQVYLFDAEEVTKRFNASRSGRIENGLVVRENFGMWVALDKFPDDYIQGIGSGIGEVHPCIFEFPIPDEHPNATSMVQKSLNPSTSVEEGSNADSADLEFASLSDLSEFTKKAASAITGLSPDKIDIEFSFST